MRKAAFATWNQRIAPVFDVARHIHLVEAEQRQIVREGTETLAAEAPGQKVLDLVQLRVGILVCGAISRPLHTLVSASGIQVLAFVAGALDEVVRAWLDDRLSSPVFAMPGCRAGWQSGWRGHGEAAAEAATFPPPSRAPKSWGRRRSRGRSGLPETLPPAPGDGTCCCPRCGHQERHVRGRPCYGQPCPACGALMVRRFETIL